MKTIIYALIAVFVFGIVATAFAITKNTNPSITIQSVETNASSVQLQQSAKVITNRLHNALTTKFDVSVVPEKNEIKITFSEPKDVKVIEYLVLHKGQFSFYETVKRQAIIDLLGSNSRLFSLLKNNKENSAKIGVVPVSEMEQVNTFIQSVSMVQNIKFVWGIESKSKEISLYALKLDKENEPLLKGSDIESMELDKEENKSMNAIKFQFKKAAIGIWSNATKRNINNEIAIIMDNMVLCSPVVHSVIDNGNCIITGDYSAQEVKCIAAIGKNGELPITFKLVK